MSGYTKPCVFCNQDIMMDNPSGKWLPFNLDGSAHECKNRDKSPSPQTQTQQPTKQPQITLSLDDIDQRLKRLERSFFGN